MAAAFPIAVVGLSCRLPGAPDPAAFWRLLAAGTDAVSARSGVPGGYLEGTDLFDPAFFGISPREAVAADPQQRLLLELAWEALEEARVPPGTLAGRAVGVFAAATHGDYAAVVQRAGEAAVTRHTLPGLNRALLANRISHALGLRGPSLTVDAAQASGLVAVQLAVESLRRGETEVALAGGVNLILAPDSDLSSARFGGLSPDGRCKVFDARANGYVRGEGGGVVVLKRLADAVADGDRVHAVILGAAAGNDGATDGLTVPSAAAQEDVVRRALADAGLSRDDVQYVELHGTGTPVGDPIEAAALGAALGAGRKAPLRVGSVKTNIGHLEGAAGIAGLLKVVLGLRHGTIPATLHHVSPNPAIPLDALGLEVQTETGPWPETADADADAAHRVAGVSSFGMGGTNCHLVLAGPPVSAASSADTGAPVVSWLVTGKDAAGLAAHAARLAGAVGELPAATVGRSLAETRAHLPHRAVIAGDRAELRAGLRALAEGGQAAQVVRGTARDRGRTVFVFPGQGAQWTGMGLALAEESPAFADALDAAGAALAPHTDWDLRAALADPAALERVDVVQPALFAVMVALAALWRAHGIEPDAVVGHSQGEIAAAHVAGALSLADAAKVVALRSRALAEISGTGGMAAVELPADRLAPLLGDALDVAVVNGPTATVVAGEVTALERLLEGLRADGVRVRRLPVDYASHSALVEPVRDRLITELSGIEAHPSEALFYSTLTGGLFDTAGLDAAYWYRNLRETVVFERTVRAAVSDGHGLFVEASPHPLLTAATGDILGPTGGLAFGTLHRDRPGLRQFLLSLGRAQTSGAPVHWPQEWGGDLADLPTYPFQRKSYWVAGAPLPGESAGLPVATPVEEPVTESAIAEGVAELAFDDALRVVLSGAAVVLGYDGPDAIDPDAAFRDLGFDSAGAVELRDRLAETTGVSLPSTLVFDHPTPRAVAALLTGADTADEEAAGASEDPIAIVAAGGRWPGGADTPEKLWALLRDGRDAIGAFPGNRGWDLDALYAPQSEFRPGTTYARNGGFLYDADRFDAAFFGISPREAAVMDPQQRLLLETGWELFERAGIDPTSLRGSRTGVFVGAMAQEYGTRLHETPRGFDGHALTGSASSVASGRLAYTLGLVGPALTVDTACSSSLVALHLAAQSLRSRECDLAVAGGVTVMATPGMFTEFSRQGGLAPDGRCKPFAAAADGTAWSEGAGLVLLARLSDAVRDGRTILAVLRGSAVNQDGASNGLTAPHGPSQERVIRAALRAGGLTPADVDAVEAHGTGTRLGDPIEAGALQAAYGPGRERPLLVGSVKSVLGHTQAAAGITGLIAMTEALRAHELPATLHIDAPSPHIDWSGDRLELLTAPRPWPRTDRPRRVGISSFGISGTNAHLVIEEPPSLPGPSVSSEKPASDAVALFVPSVPGARASSEFGRSVRTEPAFSEVSGSPDGPGAEAVVALVLSARTGSALREQAGRLRERFGEGIEPFAAGRALATTRAEFEERAVFVGAPGEAAAALRAFAEGGTAPGLVTGRAVRQGGTGFLFSGQGSQRVGMGRGLYETSPVFRNALDELFDGFAPHLDRSLHELVFDGPEELLEQTAYTQPALFAIEVALYRLAEAAGLRPTVLLGHSIGELAAAHVAGVLSARDVSALVAARGRLLQRLPSGGAMAALEASEEEIAVHLGDGLDLAAVNGAASVVVSGDSDAVSALARRWRADGRRARPLRVSHAFHSARTEPALAEFRDVAAALDFNEPRIPVISNVTGRIATGLADPEYWVRHIRAAVRFHDGVRAARDLGVTALLELGPDATLTALARESTDVPVIVPALRKDRPEPESFVTALAELHVAGVPVDWAAVHGPGPRADLPTYPFQRERYWLTAEPAAPGSAHRFLGPVLELADGGAVRTGRLSTEDEPWLTDHRVLGDVLLPGTALAELALQAGGPLADLTLEQPLVVPEEGAVSLQVVTGAPGADGLRPVSVHARTGAGPWVRHASGALGTALAAAAPVPEAWPPAGAAAVDLAALYARLAERGYEYGPGFRLLRGVWRDGATVYAETVPVAEAQGFAVHPALLDAVLHAVVGEVLDGSGVRIPFAWSGFAVHREGAEALRARIVPGREGAVALDAHDADGNPVLTIADLAFRETAGDERPYRLDWTPLDWTPPEGDRVPDDGSWTILWDGALHRDWAAVAEPRGAGPLPESAHTATVRALGLVQGWLANGEGRLAVVTRGAVATRHGSDVPGLAESGLWGLLRTAQAEHPGRIVLVDLGPGPIDPVEAAAAADAGEEQVALRRGRLLVPRLARPARDALALPDGPWRLDVTAPGSLDAIAAVPAPEAARPLTGREVRVAVRAAGLNFRDVLIGLGMYPGRASIGAEGAGTVLETGPEVTGLRQGDRVMGLLQGQLGPQAVTDARLLAPIPAGWSYAEAAAAPVAFLTAYHGLVDLGELKADDRVLIHAATGGVGGAAVQLARHLGAEVFATASPAKQPLLLEAGLDAAHVGSSRDLEFADRFGAVDVVLNALAHEFTDASLALLGPEGRFVEMGKTDLRDPADVVPVYRAFDLFDVDPDRIAALFADLGVLFEDGGLQPPPVESWDVRRTPDALRRLSQARHTGKLVATLPRRPDPDGTVLVTGGTGTLGALVARHLVRRHGRRSLLLASRRGLAAPGAAELRAELEGLGAEVEIVSADAAAPEDVRALFEGRRIASVVHAAGILDDAAFTELTDGQVHDVLRAKSDAAWRLHLAAERHDVAEFVLFSSAVGVLGNPGQAGYAAANTFLDALAARRAHRGLPAVSAAWGRWEQESAMTGGLTDAQLRRMARRGLAGLPTARALALLDRVLAAPDPALVPARLDLDGLGETPPVLRGLVRPGGASVTPSGPAAVDGLADLPEAERLRRLLQLVRETAAAVLGHAGAEAVRPDHGFQESGFDSLASVELRTRLGAAVGLRLPATFTFDHPTPAEAAAHLAELLAPEPAPVPAEAEAEAEADLASATGDELFRLIEEELRLS
ncbi:acyl transferase domain-containing protein [Actinocorallia herbida]|uniref:Acyl transferase domain-containing protein n=1 Tax=Actinocorallia herbida TaxID=58109 RepID=A0A3N1CU04_9ACTN|nr:type I polyketide synthase [Actinocorallia herbida]ROO84786.1 acyl transferase domain-containing protein [Actinocorallia herbida]